MDRNADRQTRAELLRERIADAIIVGEFALGTRLDEAELARRYGVSRTPIREALRQLAALGLAEHRPHRGVLVRRLEPERLAESFEYMADLEALCARYAALRMTPAERGELERMHDGSAELVRRGDGDSYAQTNVTFHELIYAGSHNHQLEEAALTMRRRLGPYRRGQFRLLGRVGQSLAEHSEVVAAILRGDAGQAELAMRRHVTTVSEASSAYVAAAERASAAR